MSKNNLAISVDPAMKLSKSMLRQLDDAIEFLDDAIDDIEVAPSKTGAPSITHLPNSRRAVVSLVQEEESSA